MRPTGITEGKPNTDKRRSARRRRLKRMIRLRKVIRSRLFKLIMIAAAAAAIIAVLILVFSGKNGNQTMSVNINNPSYSCGIGFEGLRVKRVMQIFNLGDTTGMGGAYYDENAYLAVSDFQQQKGLPVTGEVDLDTWKAMGLSQEEWNLCGSYRSPAAVKKDASREERIEAMIARAYDYLGDPYVIGASGPPGRIYGLDCSGLVLQGMYAAGFDLQGINPVTHAHPGHEYESRNMWTSDQLQQVDYDDRQRGDLIFYESGSGVVIHVAIYLGDDQVIESWPDEVQVSSMIDMRHPYVMGVKRVFP